MLRLTEVLAAEAALALLLFAGFLAFAAACRRRRPTRADYVVVLGSTLDGDRVTPLLASRLDAAVLAADRLGTGDDGPRYVLAGGPKAPGLLPEAHAMAAYLQQRGVPASRMLLENRSTTTEANLRNSGHMMSETSRGPYRCVIVTSDYHCPRVAVLARRLAVPAELVGAHAAATRWMLRDFAAFLATWWKPVAAGVVLLGVLTALAGG